MQKIIDFIKNNKALTVVSVVLLYILFSEGYVFPKNLKTLDIAGVPAYRSSGFMLESSMEMGGADQYSPTMPMNNNVPTGSMMTRDVNTSVVVEEVENFIDNIEAKVISYNGWIVNKSLTRPELGDYGDIEIRINNEDVNDFEAFLENEVNEVISVREYGYDVSEQYEDVEKRLNALQTALAKYNEVLNVTTNPGEIADITNRILNTQSQVDNLIGRKNALEKRASTSKYYIAASTDEINLPYAPNEKFRPEVIFKEASRALISDFYSIGTASIWLIVYSVIIVPVGGIGYWVYKKRTKK
jgi:hypothetical protein